MAVLLLCITTTAPAQTAEQIAEKALAATVYLEMKNSTGTTLGFGSGFFVRENLIATNYHVIEGAAQGTAKLVGKYTTYNIEGITATDQTNDLAILKVNAYGIKPLPLGNSDNVRIGATVYVAGNPKGLEGTFSDGIISSRRDRYTQERLQMTAPISPGSSGGPVLNRKGEIIGVSFMTIEGGQNLNFAIPSGYLRGLLARSSTAKPLSGRKQFISAETYFKWGNMKYDLGNYKGAIADYTKSLQLKPDYVGAYGNRGLAKYNLRQYFAAMADYNVAIKIKPDEANAYLGRGNVKADLGQHFAAIADYDTAIKIKPDFAEAYHFRGLSKGLLGQHGAAIADHDTTVKIKPDFAEAYYLRGLLKGLLGRYREEKQDYQTALRLAEQADDAQLKAKIEKVLRDTK